MAKNPVQPTTRRREVGAASARALLLTLLGEFVLPKSAQVWTASLINGLHLLGIEEKSARQALARTSAEGLLRSSRSGRRTLWSLAPHGETLLKEGAERIYGFMREPIHWDGSWLVLNVSIPETQRKRRHRLRTQLTWLGLGSPVSGLWITPDAAKVDDAHRVIRDLELEDQAFAWIGPTTGIGDESRLLGAAWDLDEVEDRYLGFLSAFADRRVTNAEQAFIAQMELVQAWRRFPFLDPHLPSELLDHDWPGPRAAAMFHDRHSRWERQAQQEWDRVVSEAGPTP